MKTLILLLALAVPALAQTPPELLFNDSKAFVSGPPFQAIQTIRHYDLSLCDTSNGNLVLSISGITGKQMMDGALPPFFRPESPDKVEITLTTSDGQVWMANWERVKK